MEGITHRTFNTTLSEFLGALKTTFPSEEKTIQKYIETLDTAKRMNFKLPVQEFMNVAKNYSQEIEDRDDQLFLEHADNLFDGLNFKSIWTSEHVADETRDIIWQYIQSLYIIGDSITGSSNEVLGAVDKVATNSKSKKSKFKGLVPE